MKADLVAVLNNEQLRPQADRTINHIVVSSHASDGIMRPGTGSIVGYKVPIVRIRVLDDEYE
jgi:hypothetical protein